MHQGKMYSNRAGDYTINVYNAFNPLLKSNCISTLLQFNLLT